MNTELTYLDYEDLEMIGRINKSKTKKRVAQKTLDFLGELVNNSPLGEDRVQVSAFDIVKGIGAIYSDRYPMWLKERLLIEVEPHKPNVGGHLTTYAINYDFVKVIKKAIAA